MGWFVGLEVGGGGLTFDADAEFAIFVVAGLWEGVSKLQAQLSQAGLLYHQRSRCLRIGRLQSIGCVFQRRWGLRVHSFRYLVIQDNLKRNGEAYQV